MKNVIPYSKEIIFKSNIGEISSISLEHEEEVVGNSIEGIFKVSGEYKTHEISINREDFSYDLPFSIELDEDIVTSSVAVDIEDFNYTFSKDVLKVNIEFSVTGERKKEEPKEEIEEQVEDIKKEVEESEEVETREEARNEVIFDEAIIDKINEITKNEQEAEMKKEESKEEIKQTTEIKETTETKDSETKEEQVEETTSVEEQEYVTYHVHVVREEETIESICGLYSVSQGLVSEYNDLANIKVGSQLIIPEVQDE